MSGRPFDRAPVVERRYGELRCRRYLFELPPGEPQEPAGVDAARETNPEAAPAPEGWVGVRRPQ